MAKGQKRSNRETKKPKQVKPASPASKPTTGLASSMQSLGSSMTRGSKTPIKGKF